MPEQDLTAGPGVTATMLLCDSAESVGGKLYILGGGWTQLTLGNPPAPCTMALAIQLVIPWDQANQRMTVQASLVTEDGQAVNFGEGPVVAGGEIEVGRPPGLRHGTPLDSSLAMNFNGLPLQAGGFVWELRVNDDVIARTPFRVVSNQR